MIRYTLVFVFDQKLDKVVMIRKTHPDWQAGKLNGVGGRLNEGEDPAAGAEREVLEEIGLDVHVHQFLAYYGRKYEQYEMSVFWSLFNPAIQYPESKTGEMVHIVPLNTYENKSVENFIGGHRLVRGTGNFMRLALQAAKNGDRI